MVVKYVSKYVTFVTCEGFVFYMVTFVILVVSFVVFHFLFLLFLCISNKSNTNKHETFTDTVEN